MHFRRLLFAKGREYFGFVLLGLILAYITLGPILFLLLSSVKPNGLPGDAGFTFAHYIRIYSDPATYGLLWNSLVFSLSTMALICVIAFSFAWFLERTDTPAKGLLKALIIMPMGIPPMLLAISWVLLASPNIGCLNQIVMSLFGLKEAPFDIFSMRGMIFVQTLATLPTAFLILSPAFRNMDPSLEEAALVSGASPFVMMRRILLPILLPSLLAAAAFIFIVGLVVFDIPGILGLPSHIMVFSSQVYLATHPPAGFPEFGAVSALALMFLLTMFGASYVYLKMTGEGQKFSVVTGKGYRPRMFSLGKLRYIAVTLVLSYFFLSVLAPFSLLLWTSLSPYYSGVSAEMFRHLSLENFAYVIKHPDVSRATVNTIVVAIVSATGVAALSTLLSWVVVRSKIKGAKALDVLAFIPIAIPAIMIGLALVYVYLTLRFIPIYGTIWIIAVAYITAYVSFGTRTTNGVMMQIHRELEEAAQVSGASWFKTMKRVTLPLMVPAMLSVWVWVAAHAMRELSAALMLRSRGNVVLSTLLWGLWEGGMMPAVAAVGVILTLILIILIAVSHFLAKRGRVAMMQEL